MLVVLSCDAGCDWLHDRGLLLVGAYCGCASMILWVDCVNGVFGLL